MGRVIQPRKSLHEKADAFPPAEGHTDTPVNMDEGRSASPGSKSSARTHMLSAREPGDLGRASSSMSIDGRQPREGASLEPRSQASEESDAVVVPEKSSNAQVTLAETMEGRTAAKGKPAPRNAHRTQGRERASTSLERVGQRTQRDKREVFTNLLCHLKVPLLRSAFETLRKRAATGVDGVTWSAYAEGLDARLVDLQDRIHRGAYHPMPVRRVFIPKADGSRRPLGVPALEDKIVQQAVRKILEPIYERAFLGFSYGFRPGRSPHQALDALAVAITKGKTNWVLDADIRSFFDTIDHAWMKKFLEHRIGDRRLVRLIMRWLHAGVFEDGAEHETEAGTPQGGIISPLLANVYLHYVLDLWAHDWRKHHARGEIRIVRYADDFVMTFEDGRDANSMRSALRRRLRAFGLELAAEKTRVLRFGRYARERCEALGKPLESFDFLGFTHIAGRDRQGWFQLLRHTKRSRRIGKLRELRMELRRRRHEEVTVTHAWLVQVLRGHCMYYGVPTNDVALERFRHHLKRAWLAQLARRSQRARRTVEAVKRFERRYPLPRPTIHHPWPEQRFTGPLTQGGSPVRENRTPGSVRGAPR